MRKVVKSYKPVQTDPDRISNASLPAAGNTDLMFGSGNNIRLTHKEYILVYLAYYIYERVGYFNVEDKYIGSEAFVKYQFKITELIGHAFAATL
jgi:hypothetical protein